MKSANEIPYSYMLDLFKNSNKIDETTFYFECEPIGDSYYLGCLLENHPDMPYWAGYCDLQDGFSCATAEDLFNAPYYSGKSLKERWNEIHIYEIGGVPPEQFIEWNNEEFPIDSYT